MCSAKQECSLAEKSLVALARDPDEGNTSSAPPNDSPDRRHFIIFLQTSPSFTFPPLFNLVSHTAPLHSKLCKPAMSHIIQNSDITKTTISELNALGSCK